MADYSLRYTRRAVRDIESLDVLLRRRLGRKLLEFAADPMRHAQRLVSPKLGQYRFRVGDYRIIFDLHGRDIVVLRVGHRRVIYER